MVQDAGGVTLPDVRAAPCRSSTEDDSGLGRQWLSGRFTKSKVPARG